MSELSEKIKAMREIAYASTENIQSTLRDIYNMLDMNEDILKKCYELDQEEKNQKEPLIIKRMLDTVKNVIDYKFPDIQIHEMIEERRIVEFKQNMGVIGVLYNGDVYVTVELIVKALKTGNAIVLNVGVDNFIGTNDLIVKSIKDILEKNNKSHGLVELNFSETDEMGNEEFDQIIVIGDRKRQNEVSVLNYNIIKSGYGYSEIYIEDLKNEKFIKEILAKVDNVKVFINEKLNTSIQGIRVDNCESAVKYINNIGAGYATAIFSNNAENQKMFMQRVKSKYTFINASPSMAKELDVYIEDLYYKKIGMV